MTTLYKPIQRHPYVVLRRNFKRIRLLLCERDDGGLGEVKTVDEEILHAVGVVDATLELVPRITIRDTDDHCPLPTVQRQLHASGTGMCRRWWEIRRRRDGAVATL